MFALFKLSTNIQKMGVQEKVLCASVSLVMLYSYPHEGIPNNLHLTTVKDSYMSDFLIEFPMSQNGIFWQTYKIVDLAIFWQLLQVIYLFFP